MQYTFSVKQTKKRIILIYQGLCSDLKSCISQSFYYKLVMQMLENFQSLYIC